MFFRNESKKIPVDGPWDLEPLVPEKVANPYDFDYPEEESDEDPLKPLDDFKSEPNSAKLDSSEPNHDEIKLEIKADDDSSTEILATDQTKLLQDHQGDSKSDEMQSIVITKKSERSRCLTISHSILVGGLSVALIVNAVNEIDDGIRTSPDKLSIIPFFCDELAFIPNNLIVKCIIKIGVGVYTLAFDCPMMIAGLQDTYSILIKGELPENWKKANLSKEKLRRILIIATTVSALSLVNQIISGISIVNDDEKASDDFIPLILSKVAVFVGNAAFIFSEAHKLPDTIIKLFGKMRTEYHLAHEILSLFMRIPGSLCALLFAFSAANDVFNLPTLSEKIPIAILLNSSAFATDFTYNGEYCAEVVDRFLCALEGIFRGNLPSPSALLSMLSASTIGGLLAYLQRCLTEDYLYQMDVPEVVKDYVLYPIILASTAELLVTYSGALYDPFYHLLSKVGNGISSCLHSAAARIRNLCGPRPQPEDQKPTVKRYYGNGITHFEKNGMKQPLLKEDQVDSDLVKSLSP